MKVCRIMQIFIHDNSACCSSMYVARVPPQNRRMGGYVTVGAAYFPGGGRLFYQRGVGSSKISGKSEKCGLSKVLC